MGRALPQAAILSLVLACLLIFTAPALAVVDEPDVESAADYTYVIDPDAGAVEARIDLRVTADKPDRTTPEGTLQYFLSGYRLLIPHEAEDLRVTDHLGMELRFDREATEQLSDLLSVKFTDNIYHRQLARVIIEFTLRAGTAGSDSIVRINPAYASFAAWTSPLLERASVTVELPAGYEDRSRGETTFTTETGAFGQRLVAADIDPENYYSLVSVVNDDALELDVIQLSTVVPSVGGSAAGAVQVRSWPGDEGWREYVISGVENDLPALVGLIGQPWPIDGDLTIIESFTPYLDGYAGWYNAKTGEIEVGDEQNEHVLLHELAHLWFQSELFAHRWITEGLADLYAAETVASLGGERPQPLPTATTDPDAISLADFENVSQPEEERWAYAASWALMDAVADEIGMNGLATVIDSASERRLSYLGDGEPETVRTVADWHRFLDLVENVQGVDQGPVTELIEEWVLADDGVEQSEADALGPRRQARSDYFDLVELGGDWAPPLDVRNAMMFWQFSKAESLITEAETALTVRDELLDTIEPTGAELPPDLEVLYERNDGELTSSLDDAAAAGDELREAHDHASAPRSVVQRIGLMGTDLPAETAEAVAAFNADEMGQAVDEANEVDRLVTGARGNGWFRIGLVAAVGAVAVSGVWFLLVRRRAPVPPAP